jgi:N-methylhydantoinase A
MPYVMAPRLAGTLSAYGMLMADVVRDTSQTVMLAGDTPLEELGRRLEGLAERVREDLRGEGLAEGQIEMELEVDMRCEGQSYELTTPFGEGLAEAFHRLHEQAYGYSRREARLEIVNLRARAIGRREKPALPRLAVEGEDPGQALMGYRRVVFRERARETPFYRGEDLRPGNRMEGPAVVARADTSVLIGPSDRARVDEYLNVVIEVGA